MTKVQELQQKCNHQGRGDSSTSKVLVQIPRAHVRLAMTVCACSLGPEETDRETDPWSSLASQPTQIYELCFKW